MRGNRSKVVVTLKTNDGETLDYLAINKPLPDTYVWQGRVFKRLNGPDNYYIEIEGLHGWVA